MIPYAGGNNGQVTRLRAYAGGVDSTLSLAKLARGSDLFIDSSSDVGLGTTSPNATLNILSSNAAGAFLIQNTTGYTDFFVSSSAGKVGIGTTSPSVGFQVGVGTPSNVSTANDVFVNGSIQYGGNLYGPGADVAEKIGTSAQGLTPGTVVELNPEEPDTIRESTGAYSTLVAGVVSTRPGITLGDETRGVALAVAGRVPVKADTANGPIAVGDLLTTSSTPGEAMRCTEQDKCFGAVLGKAMEPLPSGSGTITALVTIG